MIVRETTDSFVMTTQHDHAILSGRLARHIHKALFPADHYYKDALFAVSQHDRSWIRLDEEPIWNDRERMPYSFMDYPILPKITLYKFGLDETETMNAYACLLCSMHYASFFHMQSSIQPACKEFYQGELNRQSCIKEQLGNPDEKGITRHFQILQLCDDLSLYVCLNEDGASKEREHPWFRNEFDAKIDGRAYRARWRMKGKIAVAPDLFEGEFETSVRMKHVPKKLVEQEGIASAYRKTEWTTQLIVFSNEAGSVHFSVHS